MDSPSGGGSTNTVTNDQTLLPFQQDFANQNQSIAASIASQPFPTYQGQLVAGFDPMQTQALGATPGAANSYQPGLTNATNLTNNAATSYQPMLNQAGATTNGAVRNWDAGTASQYMSPYIMQALAPQMQALQQNQQMQQHQIDAGATSAGAFGDARHGVAQATQNFNNNLALNDLVGQGMNTAYTTGLQAFQNQESQQLAQGQQQAALAGMQQNLQLAPAQQQAALAAQQQQLGLNATNAIFGAGTQNQELQQQQLNSAYQNYLNQVNWPIEMLNLRESTLTNQPYSTSRITSATPGNSTAQNVGAFAALSGGLGSLLGNKNG